MNLRQSYEHLIAHKLRKLPAPDADASWQQMKRLLDEDDDTRAGGKRNPGNGSGWWRIGIIAIILSASGWLYFNNATSPASNIAKTKATEISNNNQSSTIDKNTTLTTSRTTRKANELNNVTSAATGAAPSATAAPKGSAILTNKYSNSESASASVTIANPISDNRRNTARRANQTHTDANELVAINTAKINHRAGLGVSPDNNILTTGINSGATGKHRSSGYTNNYRSETPIGAVAQRNEYKTSYGSKLSAGTKGNKTGTAWLSVDATNATNTDWFAALSNLENNAPVAPSNTVLTIGDSIQNNRNTAVLLNADTKKAVAKAQRDRELEDMTRKEHKRFHLDLSNAFKPFSLHMDAEPRWAAGIALNNGITLGAQNRFNYSMNAKSGALTDYIPSLYLQFHLNDFVFAQTELNFISPQYTPQLLVFRQNNDVTAQAGITQQKSVFVQKLYYFSIPVSLHYSPINNLYFSAGLQFSSFQSGLATIQEKQYTTSSGPDHPNSISNTVLKFKDDSIAAKLAPNEWRWQVGAEYYFNRFTVGLRYNRSFKNLVTSDAASTVPAAAGLHNQSMILFMRYNLFESRKKKTNAE